MKGDITLNDLEQISKMLGVEELHNQGKFRAAPEYRSLLIYRIKEYLFDKKSYSAQKYFQKAEECFNMEEFSAAQMYLEKGIIKFYNAPEQIMEIEQLALKIYEKISPTIPGTDYKIKSNTAPNTAFSNALALAKKVSIINF